MANSIWNIDGKNVKGSDGAVIKWDDNRYFTLTFNGHDFNGELLEENTEGNFLKLKINHRVFEIKKKGELDDLIAALGLDVPKVRKLKELPANFELLAATDSIPVAAYKIKDKEVYGLQFHPEVTHSTQGLDIIKNFVFCNK
mgnify:CR=1 FL=1